MDSNIKERLKKVQALALRGVPGGEKEAAQALLEKLMKKYNISISELEEDAISECEFEYHGSDQERLLMQTIYKVTDNKEVYTLRYSLSGRKCRTRLIAYCTPAQAVEIKYLFDFYKRLWEREKEALLTAYIQKHRIFGTLKDGEKPKEVSYEELAKMGVLMQGLSDDTPRKCLSTSLS